MSEMKMSDVFELPVKQNEARHFGNVVYSVPDDKVIFGAESIKSAEYIAHAINNYDKLTEQNAKLVEMLDKIIKEADYSYALDVDLYDSANQLLTEIKEQK